MNQKKIKWEEYNFSFDEALADEEDEVLAMNTAMGVFRIDDSMNPFRRFEFKMGHTNFDITADIMSSIETTEGVEALIVVSRYRFIIASGRAFKLDSVTHDIEKTLCQHPSIRKILSSDIDSNLKGRIIQVYDQVCGNKFWGICILPNGEIDYCKYKTDCDAFVQKLKVYVMSSMSCESVVITSENE